VARRCAQVSMRRLGVLARWLLTIRPGQKCPPVSTASCDVRHGESAARFKWGYRTPAKMVKQRGAGATLFLPGCLGLRHPEPRRCVIRDAGSEADVEVRSTWRHGLWSIFAGV
jgi:hypothetical protein